jgi:pimeloyl-ACP methyl ester carboxylesterase
MRYVLPRALYRMNLLPAYADPAFVTPELLDRYYELTLAPGARGAMLERLRQTVLTDPVPQLARIRAPTLLLWGERDAMIPFANSDDYMRAVPNIRRVAFPSVGHLPHEEAAARSLLELRRFLDAAVEAAATQRP